MPDPTLSNAGRELLNRRRFLEHAGTGLGGIALASLLANQDCSPPRPRLSTRRSGRTSAPRIRWLRGRSHFAGKAKRVLVIFARGRAASSSPGITSRP